MVKYKKVMIIVFSEDEKQRQLHFNLFRLMLKDKIEKCIDGIDSKRFETDKFDFKFFIKKNYYSRCNRAHYVLNLTQDKEFHECIAIPITHIHWYLKDDEDWSELFEGINLYRGNDCGI